MSLGPRDGMKVVRQFGAIAVTVLFGASVLAQGSPSSAPAKSADANLRSEQHGTNCGDRWAELQCEIHRINEANSRCPQ